ncbi:hypothetical protein C5167_025016 [Papaver somniferum]|uniref:DCD domain-containing protein n=1 Tax=Papaver somniferum TaxID=3469 RepID=A0A4Y7JTI6_PAPSO|nr:uncharacterized protein LOC113278282 [Papaver somniferum]RZC63261.1 hypothetical protein C5167_025016 [Papaver somniferum]
MGAGRKKKTNPKTNPLPERVVRHPSVNCSVTARNLRTDELGGVILGCTRETMTECLTNKIFGLPAFHISYIRKIKPGLPLFLFNYSDRKMHGIFEATSNGEMNINPCGWSEDGQELTKYPAQVRVCVRMQCKSLLEEQYKPILIDNYYTEDFFWFELDHTQTRNLISLFEPLVIAKKPKRASKHEKKGGRVSEGSKVTQLSKRHKPNVPFKSQAKVQQYSSNWHVLLDLNSDSSEPEEEGQGSSISEDETPLYMGINFEIGSSSATPFEEENEEEVVHRKLLQLVNQREQAKSHSFCRRSVSRWFSAVPLSGYVALVFIALACLRLYSEV